MLSNSRSRAGRPTKDLNEFQEEISALFRDGHTYDDIAKHLLTQYNFPVNGRTIQRRLKQWDVSKRVRPLKEEERNLQSQVKKMFFEGLMTDREMLYVLRKQGFQIGIGGLRTIRRRLNLYRRVSNEQFEEYKDNFKLMVQQELDKGTIEGYGRKYLYTYFRSQQHIISRDRLFQIVKEKDPIGVTRRLNDFHRTRGDFSVPGPNYLWSIDGHDKLSYWGFQIYAGIDAYSRYVTWIYVGNSNRTSFSVLRQYLDTLKSEKKQPRLIRSDKGGETPMLAAAHYALYQRHNTNATLSDCYWYGTSMSNQRIEAWWSQLTKGCTHKWRDYFLRLNQDGLFRKDQLADRISITAVYMPLLRGAICNFVRLWNVHEIRKQKERPDGVYGKPYFLYFHPEDGGVEDYGLTADENLVNELLNDMDYWDIDEYLPEETLHWCQQKLNELGFTNLTISDAFPNGIRHHCTAYIALRECVKAHISSRAAPLLAESQPPTQQSLSRLNMDDIVDNHIEEATLAYEAEEIFVS